MAVLICSWPCRLVHVMGKSGEWKRFSTHQGSWFKKKQHALIKPGILCIHSTRGVSWEFGCWWFRFVMISPIWWSQFPWPVSFTWWPISPRFHDRIILCHGFFQAVIEIILYHFFSGSSQWCTHVPWPNYGDLWGCQSRWTRSCGPVTWSTQAIDCWHPWNLGIWRLSSCQMPTRASSAAMLAAPFSKRGVACVTRFGWLAH